MAREPTMTEIKPCPFCGSEAQFESSFSGGPYVLCVECGAAAMFANNEKHAAALWNTRTPDPSLIAGLREAREALARLYAVADYMIDGAFPCSPEQMAAFDVTDAALAKLDTLLSEGGQ